MCICIEYTYLVNRKLQVTIKVYVKCNKCIKYTVRFIFVENICVLRLNFFNRNRIVLLVKDLYKKFFCLNINKLYTFYIVNIFIYNHKSVKVN